MADRFLREIRRMHQLRQDINEMTPEEADEPPRPQQDGITVRTADEFLDDLPAGKSKHPGLHFP